jgi:hypothetical protein
MKPAGVLQLVAPGLLLLLCSCVTKEPAVQVKFPVEVPMNPGAGRGDNLVVNLRLANGEELPVIVDTGGPAGEGGLVLDKCLEPQLGKRLGTRKFIAPGIKDTAGIYHAPTVYLANVPLPIGTRVITTDTSRFCSGYPVRGILGMDCLQHYCVQLDFAARKLRLLDPDHPGGDELGQAFPLSFFGGYPVVRDNLVGVRGATSVIDTGCNFDGVLTPKLFRHWTESLGALPVRTGEAPFPNGVLGGNTYTNLYMHGDGQDNLLGQLFLARHLVTLNFPRRVMFLRKLRSRSLAEGNGLFDSFYPVDLRKEKP